jgi:X-X-X-Leu-X-X-Gly heptad repeat protein
MPDITLTFEDGKQHVYQNAPDTLKPEDVYARASKDFPDAKIKAIARGTTAAAPTPKAPSGSDIVVGPEGGITYTDPEKQKQFVSGQAEGIKGLASGAGQMVTGVGELIPFVGPYAAQGTKYLQGVGDPTAQKIGEFATAISPLPFGKGKAVTEGAGLLSRLLGGAKTGAITGATFGAAAPTGEEGVGRYWEKAKQALEGGTIGGLLGGLGRGIFGARAPTVSSEELYAKSRATGESLADTAKKMAEDLADKDAEKAKKIYSDIVRDNRQLFEAEGEVGSARAMKAGEEARNVKKDPLNDVAQQRQTMLEKFGPERDLTQIGKPIQETATQAKQTIENERSRVDQKLRAARNEISSENEASGRYIADTPTARKLLSDISKQRDPVTAPEFERRNPGLKRLQDRVYETLVNRRVELSPEEAKKAVEDGQRVEIKGTRFFRTFRSSLDAVDDLRRFMGEVFSGQPAEGYEGISAGQQKNLYEKLSSIEREYVGSVQDKLQKNWREATQTLSDFETKHGKALTDLTGPNGAFSKDSASIPGAIFRNQDSVSAAIQLTKNPETVRTAARQYLRSQIKDMDAKQVSSFLSNSKNRDWLNHPELKLVLMDAQKHAADLAKAESRAGALKSRAEASAADVKRIQKETTETLDRIKDETKKALQSKDKKISEVGKQLKSSLDTLSEFKTALAGDPGTFAKNWPKIRTSLENTKLFQAAELDAFQADLLEAGKVADKEARAAAYADTVTKLLQKKAAKALGLGALTAAAGVEGYKSLRGD